MNLNVALVGNPNCGKTTLFNALTGANQYVGNWPGVTVEKKAGKLKARKDVNIVDLPGIYSLSPYTLEEVIARDYLIEERPQAILSIIDGTNLERNLYLSTQVIELGIPMVIAVNMVDLLKRTGNEIDLAALSGAMGVPVVAISALKGTGVQEVAERLIEVAESASAPVRVHRFEAGVEGALDEIESQFGGDVPESAKRFYAIKLFERDFRISDQLQSAPNVDSIIEAAERKYGDDSESIIVNERYGYITDAIDSFLVRSSSPVETASGKIDRVVTNRILALPIFFVVMFLVYFLSVSTIGAWGTDWVNDGLFGDGWSAPGGVWAPSIPVVIGGWMETAGVSEPVQSLVLDGVVAGVGSILGFIPQMLVLFFLLAFLEGCGYMARVAFILDRVFRHFGLSGKSFIPMLVATGCGVPGIMASRTIENESDRRMTVMTTTFIPCGAKLPIIALIAGAVFDGAWWVAPSVYFMGIGSVLASGVILKKLKPFSSKPASFVMELPAYHLPTLGSMLRSMWERSWSFVKKAGTVVFAASVLIWFVSGYGFVNGEFGAVANQGDSILAAFGKAISWIFAPLGFGNWQAAAATVSGLIAKENVVATLGILYAGPAGWYANVQASYTAAAAYSFMAFNMLCAPCFAAIGAIRREMNNPKWFWAAVGYECGWAYAVALMIYQIGGLISGDVPFGFWTVVASAVAAGIVFMLVRPCGRSSKTSDLAASGLKQHLA